MSPAPPTPSHIFADHDNHSWSLLGVTVCFASGLSRLSLPGENLINSKETKGKETQGA